MINYKVGDILTSDHQALVNTVNTVGVMGKGIALKFKKTFPIVEQEYQEAVKNNLIKIGKVQVVHTNMISPKFVINFPTKKHWKNPSKLEYIDKGLQDLVNVIMQNNIKSISIPPLGCGNGKLSWHKVKPLMEYYLLPLSEKVDITIFEPGYHEQRMINKKDVKLTPARAMLIYLMMNYQVLGYSINLLVVQKLAYFLQKFGKDLKLEYEKGFYGPYAHRLLHLLKYLNGYYIFFKEENNKPNTSVKLNEKTLPDVFKYYDMEISEERKQRVEQVLNLVNGFESPYGLELLATVDFVVDRTSKASPEEIQFEISSWTNRKKELMKPYHIKVAHQRLSEFQLI